MPDGSNVYKVLIEKMAAFQTKLLAETDDTVSYLLLVKVSATITVSQPYFGECSWKSTYVVIRVDSSIRLKFRFCQLEISSEKCLNLQIYPQIWSHLLMYDAQRECDYYNRKDLIKVHKSNYGCEIGPVYTNLRPVLIAEVAYKHTRRWLMDGIVLTEMHKIAAMKLLDLATCDYSSVRELKRIWNLILHLN